MNDSQGSISIQHVKKSYMIEKQKLEVLHDINIEVPPQSILSIVGKSGCGKSTLLRMIAGLEKPDSGRILISGQEVKKPSVDIGVLFQESRLLPWNSTEKNIAFGLPGDVAKQERKELVRENITMVGLNGFEKAYPGQLSGGMQKRVAIARTLINRPHILLLDEPFGALDAFTRMNLQEEALRLGRQEKMTILLVTHDIEEAIYMGDQVVVMSPKPGIVKKMFKVELPKPKNRTSEAFDRIRQNIYREFFEDRTPQVEYQI